MYEEQQFSNSLVSCVDNDNSDNDNNSLVISDNDNCDHE